MSVVFQRRKLAVSLGDGTYPALIEKLRIAADDPQGLAIFNNKETAGMATSKYWDLTRAVRAHGNFCEHVPWVLLLSGISEINGLSSTYLHLALGSVLAARLLHNHYGVFGNMRGIGIGRVIGTVVTFLSIIGLGMYNTVLYLTK
ncbi:hypothetical protein HK098_006689 [Nowakowskiella sp. JEL0407]|nr:hypothetical protein HK098_006689 [Nowakowskiella sp. JEL0407]